MTKISDTADAYRIWNASLSRTLSAPLLLIPPCPIHAPDILPHACFVFIDFCCLLPLPLSPFSLLHRLQRESLPDVLWPPSLLCSSSPPNDSGTRGQARFHHHKNTSNCFWHYQVVIWRRITDELWMEDKFGATGGVDFGKPNSTPPFDIILYQIQRRPSAVFDHGSHHTRHCLICRLNVQIRLSSLPCLSSATCSNRRRKYTLNLLCVRSITHTTCVLHVCPTVSTRGVL